jgi:hypothetical protein
MGVHVADALAVEMMAFDELKHFRICRRHCDGQGGEVAQNGGTVAQVSQGQFADDEGVGQNTTAIQMRDEFRHAGAQMIDPDRGVDEDQAIFRRGVGARSGSEPPRRASRRALSLSIRAFKASRTRLDFSFRPVRP